MSPLAIGAVGILALFALIFAQVPIAFAMIIVGVVGNVPEVWVNPQYANIFIYVTLLAVFFIRPQGILGQAGGTALNAQSLRDV